MRSARASDRPIHSTSACTRRRSTNDCSTSGALAKRSAWAALTLAALLPAPALAQAPYRNPTLPVESRARDLLGRMTLEEKFWQLFMLPGNRADPSHDYSHGVFGLQDRTAPDARADAVAHNALQRYFADSTRLGIPMLAFEEGVHGRGGTPGGCAGAAYLWLKRLNASSSHPASRSAGRAVNGSVPRIA